MSCRLPMLANVCDEEPGCVLVTDSGDRIRLDISYTSLELYLRARGFPRLGDICGARNAEIWLTPWKMTESEWSTISEILRLSPGANEMRRCRSIRRNLELPFSELRHLPLRLYGGVGQPIKGRDNGPTLYIDYPFHFRSHHDRGLPWYYSLLNSRGGNLYKTHVNVETQDVELECAVMINHFVESADAE